MSRTDYVAIAAAIRETKDEFVSGSAPVDVAIEDALFAAASRITDVLEADSGSFDSERFVAACGFTP
jgi:hypothetical protein